MKAKRILHAPLGLSQAWALSNAERELGHKSEVMAWRTTPLDYPVDIDLRLAEVGILKRAYRLLAFFFRALFTYDVFHFYSRSILVYADLPLLKLLGKKIVFNFQGSDIRQQTVLVNNLCLAYPFLFSYYTRKGNVIKKLIAWWVSVWADHIVMITPDLQSACPKARLFSHAYDLRSIKPSYPDIEEVLQGKRAIRVAHAPTNRIIKGTDVILQTIENLKKKGIPITLHLIENTPHDETLRSIENCDVYIDQLWLPYGVAAVEAMALGKPVVSYIEPSLKERFPFSRDLPIVEANICTLESVLQNLVEHPSTLPELGKRSRAFVEQHHNAHALIRDFIEAYYS